ncbi:pteridine-dependent deoxygenase [Fontimonas sp. SYSU GA230001]|uniref:chorismate transformation enzyme, FkbO/Hyg5 family n=1 Tax=Fontimonas sp. SYSU GA230001 TaxID=3142450 RepID=UPI0032B44F4B
MTAHIFNSRALRCEYVAPDTALPAGALGRVEFGRGARGDDDPRRVRVGLEALELPCWAEQWVSTRPVRSGRADGFGYSHDGEVLFGQIHLPEAELVDLERATLKLYVHIEQLLRKLGYPHCLRMWNFLAGINAGEGDHERYRLFSAGRSRALALKPDFEQRLPAATAIGMAEPGLVVYFLAGKQPGQPVENPRQVSAYRYPRQYGPRSPSFARATLIGAGADSRLLVSGTASVVGHESVHPGDPVLQLDETLRNFDALIDNALARHFGGLPRAAVHAESVKLYLRDPGLLPALRGQLTRLRGAGDVPLLVLHGDICRSDLILEAEAVFRIDAPL